MIDGKNVELIEPNRGEFRVLNIFPETRSHREWEKDLRYKMPGGSLDFTPFEAVLNEGYLMPNPLNLTLYPELCCGKQPHYGERVDGDKIDAFGNKPLTLHWVEQGDRISISDLALISVDEISEPTHDPSGNLVGESAFIGETRSYSIDHKRLVNTKFMDFVGIALRVAQEHGANYVSMLRPASILPSSSYPFSNPIFEFYRHDSFDKATLNLFSRKRQRRGFFRRLVT